MARKWTVVAVFAALFAGCGGDEAGTRAGESLPGAKTVPGMVVVDFEDGTTKAEYDAIEAEWGVDLEFNSEMGPETGITIGEAAGDLPTLLARIRRHPQVEAAGPAYVYETTFEPNDPQYPHQWHLRKAGAPRAWPLADGRGVVVAVIDTGVAYADEGGFKRVEDLAGVAFVPGHDFVNDRDAALDDHGHGTHVAGTVAQATNNGVGVAGLAHGARLMPLKVLSAEGWGHSADIADAVRFATDHGAKVINMSLGGGGHSRVMALALQRARRKGVVVVAAAGNAGVGQVGFPAAYPGVLGVSATRFDDALAPYSSFGREVDLAAPGGDKTVDQDGDGMADGVLQNTIARGDPTQSVYELYQGTSMATPHVAAAAAMVMSTGVTDPEEVEQALLSTARKVHGRSERDDKFGHGVVDAGAAVAKARRSTGLWRSVWVAVMALLLVVGRGRMPRPVGLRTCFWVPLVLTGVGLFFLPWLLPDFPGRELLSSPLMDWGRHAFGARWHANPLTWSAVVPLGLAVALFHRERLRPVLAGISAGAAAFLFHALFSGHADVVLLPGRLLDSVWLLANGLLAFLLSWTLTRRRGET